MKLLHKHLHAIAIGACFVAANGLLPFANAGATTDTAETMRYYHCTATDGSPDSIPFRVYVLADLDAGALARMASQLVPGISVTCR